MGGGRREGVEGSREVEKCLTCITGPIHRATSVINGVTYPPWNDADLSELRTVSALPQDYKDPAGLIPLASKQKAQLGAWMRPHQICDHPKMVHLISSLTIKQVCSLRVLGSGRRRLSEYEASKSAIASSFHQWVPTWLFVAWRFFLILLTHGHGVLVIIFMTLVY